LPRCSSLLTRIPLDCLCYRCQGVCLRSSTRCVRWTRHSTRSTNHRCWFVSSQFLFDILLHCSSRISNLDTTTLSNRGLITSTVSLPWLLTTWIGPPLGAFFQRRGPIGYRLAYATFGILLPLLATVLFCTLWLEWKKIKRKAVREGRTPSTRDLGFGVSTRAAWKTARSVSVIEEGGARAGLHHQHYQPGRSSLSAVSEDEDEDDTVQYGRRDRRLSHAADAAANELSKRKRWRMSIWDKAAELWKDLDVVGLVALTVGCGAFLLPFTLAMKTNHSWASREFLS